MIAVVNTSQNEGDRHVLVNETSFDFFGYEEDHKITVSNPSSTSSVILKILIPSHLQYKWKLTRKPMSISQNSSILLGPQRSVELTIFLKKQEPIAKSPNNSFIFLSHCHRDKILLLTGILPACEVEKFSKEEANFLRQSQLIEGREAQGNLWDLVEGSSFQKYQITINNFFMVHSNPQYTCISIQKIFSRQSLNSNREFLNSQDKQILEIQKSDQKIKEDVLAIGRAKNNQIDEKEETENSKSTEKIGNDFQDEDSGDSENEEEEENIICSILEKETEKLINLVKEQIKESPIDIIIEGDKLFLAFEQGVQKKLSNWQPPLLLLHDFKLSPIAFFFVVVQPAQNYTMMLNRKNFLIQQDLGLTNFSVNTSPKNNNQIFNQGSQGNKGQEDYTPQRESIESVTSPLKHLKGNSSKDTFSLYSSFSSQNDTTYATNFRSSNKTQNIQYSKLSFQTIFEARGEEDCSFRDQFQPRHLKQIDFPVNDKSRQTAPQFPSNDHFQKQIAENEIRTQSETSPKENSSLHFFENEDFHINKLSETSRSQKEGSIHTGQNDIKHIMLSDDSSHFITAAESGLITVWEIATKESIKFEEYLSSQNRRIQILKSFGDNDRFMIGGDDTILRIYSLKQKKLISSIEVKRKIIYCATFLQDLNLIAIAGLNLSKLDSLGKQTKRRNIKLFDSNTYKYVKKYNIPSTQDIVTHIEYCQYPSHKTQNISSQFNNITFYPNQEQQDCTTPLEAPKHQTQTSNKANCTKNNKNNSNSNSILACIVQGSYGSRLVLISLSKAGKKLSICLNCELLTINIYKVHRLFYSSQLSKLICMPKPSEKRGQNQNCFYEIDISEYFNNNNNNKNSTTKSSSNSCNSNDSKIQFIKHVPSFQIPIIDMYQLQDEQTVLVVPLNQHFYLYDLKEQAIIDRSNSLPDFPKQVHISPQNIAAILLHQTEGKVNIYKLPS